MDDATTPPEQGQGDQQAPDTGQAAEGQNWEHQYNELRPAYTRATQQLSEYEQLFQQLQDPELQAEALAELGFEVAEDESEEGSGDELDFDDPLEARLDALEADRRQQAETAEVGELEEMRDEYIDGAIEYISSNLGRTFSERQQEALGNLAIQLADDRGVPDVQQAYGMLYGEDGVLEEERRSWIDSKRNAAQAPSGQSGTGRPDLSTRKARVDYINERARAQEEADSY